MSHQDAIIKLENFSTVAATADSKYTIIENTEKKILWCSISSRSNSYKKWC